MNDITAFLFIVKPIGYVLTHRLDLRIDIKRMNDFVDSKNISQFISVYVKVIIHFMFCFI